MTTIQLSIFTYNTHLYNNAIKQTPSGWLASKFLEVLGISSLNSLRYLDTERTQGIVKHIKSCAADIVGLVEVWDDALAEDIINAVKDVYKYWYRPPAKTAALDLKFIGNGLLLLSKHQLSEEKFYNYNQLSSVDKYSCKGILTAKAELPNPSAGGNSIKVRFFLTHTQAAYTKESYEDIRQANIAQLADTVKDYQTGRAYNEDTDIPIFIFGDFNVIAESQQTGQTTSEYQKTINCFQKVQLTDSYRDLHSDFNRFPGYTYFSDGVNQPNKLITKFAPEDAENKVHQRLDYIFYNQKGSAITVTPTEAQVLGDYTFPDGGGEMDLSDHEPLLGKFNLEI